MPGRPRPRRRPRAAAAVGPLTAALLTAALLTAGCDTGDGRQLDPPTAPPPSTAPPSTAPPESGADGAPPGETSGDGAFGTVGPEDVAVDPPPEFEVFAAWRDGAPIDERYTCDGDDVSPALTWTGVPDGTVELAVTAVDDDADGFVHWVVTGIDPSTVSILEGELPPGASAHGNSFGGSGWAGPCPPEGPPHTYRFTVHALDQQLEGLGEETPEDAVALIAALALDSTSVTGVYAR